MQSSNISDEYISLNEKNISEAMVNNEDSNKFKNTLIVYFSRVGNTPFKENVDAISSASIQIRDGKIKGNAQIIAEEIQKQVGGDIVLIKPKEEYSTDYYETVEKSHQEFDTDDLPELEMSIDNLNEYQTVFVVYPTWSSDLPKRVASFLAQYSMEGKDLIPVCTHAGYGYGSSLETIELLCPNAHMKESFDITHNEIDEVEQLSLANVETVIFDKVQPNPLKETDEEGGKFARKHKCDFIVALGGGSVIDSAKVMAVMATNDGDLWDYITSGTGKGAPIKNKPLPIVAISTTAGTGSEADAGAVITNPQTNEKVGLKTPDLFPVLCIEDPELMKSVPATYTAYQGFDALSHSLEGYI